MRTLTTARASTARAGSRAIWRATGSPTATYHAAIVFPLVLLVHWGAIRVAMIAIPYQNRRLGDRLGLLADRSDATERCGNPSSCPSSY
eukprot:5590655-Pyramimonas_sp.AAC.1